MDVKCIKSSIDFLFPRPKFTAGLKCTPLVLVKGSFPSKIKKDKIKLAGKEVNPDQEYNFVCSLVQLEGWLSTKTLVANCIFDTPGFGSCANPLSKLPTKQNFYCKEDKIKAAQALMTPARILANKHLDILDFQTQNKRKKLKGDEYYGIIHTWLKKT